MWTAVYYTTVTVEIMVDTADADNIIHWSNSHN